MTGFQTPAIQSGVNSPFYIHSRAGSTENLSGMMNGAPTPFAPSALSMRLADVSIDPSQRSTAFNHGSGPVATPRSEPASTSLTRSNSSEEERTPGSESPQNIHIDESEFAELNKVPSYSTAVRTPASIRNQAEALDLPDYQTAVSAPRTPPSVVEPSHWDGLPSISEDAAGEHVLSTSAPEPWRTRNNSQGAANHRGIDLMQPRGQVV